MTSTSKDEHYPVRHQLSPRQVLMVLAGGHIPLLSRQAQQLTVGMLVSSP